MHKVFTTTVFSRFRATHMNIFNRLAVPKIVIFGLSTGESAKTG